MIWLTFLENYASILKSLQGGIGILFLIALGFGVYLIIKKRKIDWSSGPKNKFNRNFSLFYIFYFRSFNLSRFSNKISGRIFCPPSIPWLTGLFEIKEYLGAIGLFTALILLGYYYFFKIEESEKPIKQSFINLLFVLFLITIFKAVVGIILGFYKSI